MPERQRFAVLAEGLELLADSVATFESDASTLAASRSDQGAAALRTFADEEAAKVLILLDIARAGWKDHAAVNVAMSSFYSHLARGLYAQAYGGAPADLAEVRRYVDMLRQRYYLDGPMDVDWIFGNEVLTNREERLYVDYIEAETGDRRWTGPADRARLLDEPFRFPAPTSVPVQLIAAMRRVGLLTEEGLSATRRVWDGVVVEDSMHWSELRPLSIAVLDELVEQGLDLRESDNIEAARYVLEHWIFPLTSLDLTMAEVDIQDLKRRRDRWLAAEMGIEDDFGPYV
jgi:hypothetical protein